MRFGWIRKVDVQVLVAGGLLLVVGLLLRAKVYHDWPRILEGGLYIGGLLLLAAHQPLRQMLGALPRLQRRFLLGLVGVMILAQVWSDPQKTFPFIPWAMYTKRLPDPPVYFEYVGICSDGRAVLIPVTRVFRSQHRTVAFRLHGRWRRMHSTDNDTYREQLRQEYRELLFAMVNRFNEQHPDSEVGRVRVVKCTMPRPAPGRKLDVTRLPLQEYTIK